jgi:hypothetical protein
MGIVVFLGSQDLESHNRKMALNTIVAFDPLLQLLFLSSKSDTSPQFLFAMAINEETC